uniref:Uncharacterized protein MANES_06G142500 n=1 Tax=Rhizophora mucronata TaxID=61149 RepID=A0A2P2M834_RHIMU
MPKLPHPACEVSLFLISCFHIKNATKFGCKS